MSNVSNNYKPKGIVLETIALLNYKNEVFDLSEFITGFRLYEDLMSSTLSLDIGVIDAVALIERLPIVGDETIFIQFRTPTFDDAIELAFDVYKVDARKKESDRGDSYNIRCVSRELIQSMRQQADKAYVGYAVSDVVTDVYNNYLREKNRPKPLYVEPTLGKHSFIAPEEQPLNFIRMLSSEARSKKHQYDSFYMFYEDHKGFNFRSLAELYEQEPVEDFYYAEADLPEQAYFSGERKVDAGQKVMDLTFEPSIDIIKQMSSGLIDNQALVVDPIFKKKEVSNFLYDRDFDKLTKLGKNKILGDISIRKEATGITHKRYFVGSLSRGNYYQTSYLNNRCTPIEPLSYYPSFRHKFVNPAIASSAGLFNMGINLTIPGNSDIKCGDIINLFVPSNTKDEEFQFVYNKFFGDPDTMAKFIVVRATHGYTTESGEYITELKIVKDAFANKVTTELEELGQ